MIQKSVLFENDRTAIKITAQVVQIQDLHGNPFAIYRHDGSTWNRQDLPSIFPTPYSFETLTELGEHFVGSGFDLEN